MSTRKTGYYGPITRRDLMPMDHGGDPFGPSWSYIDITSATQEGWDLFLLDSGLLEIQRVDDYGCGAPLASDEEAVHHVRWMAAAGSRLHIKALRLHGSNLREHKRRSTVSLKKRQP